MNNPVYMVLADKPGFGFTERNNRFASYLEAQSALYARSTVEAFITGCRPGLGKNEYVQEIDGKVTARFTIEQVERRSVPAMMRRQQRVQGVA